MKNRFKKLPKKRQNSDYWIYGHHAVIGALNNNNREKGQHRAKRKRSTTKHCEP